MQLFQTAIGSFVAITIVGLIAKFQFIDQSTSLFLIGSFGATAVMIFAMPESSFAQPKNVILGHLISSLVGVSAHLLMPESIIICSAIAVSLSIVLMQLTGSLHPPGGATALIAVAGGPAVYNLGYSYVISPVLLGALTLLTVAWLVKTFIFEKTRRVS